MYCLITGNIGGNDTHIFLQTKTFYRKNTQILIRRREQKKSEHTCSHTQTRKMRLNLQQADSKIISKSNLCIKYSKMTPP